MKNLLIIASRYPHLNDTASSIFVYSQIEELKKNFEKILIISTTPYIPKLFKRWMEPRRRLDSLAEDYNYDNVEVYFTKNIILPIKFFKKFRGWQGYRSSKKILKKAKFELDIIHAHFTWPSGYVAIKLKEDYNVPSIITAHGYDVYDLPFRNKYYFNIIKKIFSKTDHIITVSKKNRDILVNKLNVSIKKITVIPNGYSSKLFHPLNKKLVRKKLSLPLNKKIVLSVGNLVPVKGQIYLVDTANTVIQKKKDILFIIIGEGPERKTLESKIKEYSLEDNFILVGAKPHDEIPLWMNACDIFILPSLRESFGTVQIEAMACGKPIIATFKTGGEEIIINEKLGILVKSKDVDELAKAIFKALNTKWDREYILNYVEQFTWDNIAKQIINVYDKVLK